MEEQQDDFGTDLCVGKITKYNWPLLSFTKKEYNHLCEGWGSNFCLDCPFQRHIPIAAKPLPDPLEAPITKSLFELGFVLVLTRCLWCTGSCVSCELFCPCNRSYKYDEVRKAVMVSENERIHSGVLTGGCTPQT